MVSQNSNIGSSFYFVIEIGIVLYSFRNRDLQKRDTVPCKRILIIPKC